MTIKAFNLSLSLETRKRMGNSVQISCTTQHERIHSEDNSIGRSKLYSLCNGWITVQKGIYELSAKNLELVFLEAKVENEITGEVIAHILSKVTPKGASAQTPSVGRYGRNTKTLIMECQRAIADETKASIASPAMSAGFLSEAEWEDLRSSDLNTYLTFCALMLAIFDGEI